MLVFCFADIIMALHGTSHIHKTRIIHFTIILLSFICINTAAEKLPDQFDIVAFSVQIYFVVVVVDFYPRPSNLIANLLICCDIHNKICSLYVQHVSQILSARLIR